MDDRETRQAIYAILTAVECFNEDPKGVTGLLEALGDTARHAVLHGSDEQKIHGVSQALVSERKEKILQALSALELEIEPLDIPEEPGAVPAAPKSRDAKVEELEYELDTAFDQMRKLRGVLEDVRSANAKLEDETKLLTLDVKAREDELAQDKKALTEAQKKITSLEKSLEKKGG